MSYSNWGTNNETGAAATQKNVQKYADLAGKTIGTYHQSYAKTLEMLGNIIIYAIPLIPAILVYYIVNNILPDTALFIGVLIYAILAFTLWVTVSYCVKLFDNISKMAQNTEILLALISKETSEDD